MLIDSHCHINMPELAAKLPQVFENMAHNKIQLALAISVSRQTYREVLALAETYPNVFASVGVHPEEADEDDMTLAELLAAACHPKIVGIGEAGLDYHFGAADNAAALAHQHRRFLTHIEAANTSGLPLIVHTRDAQADTLRLLREAQAHAGVIHCCTENTDFARAALDMGFYISFSGIVTFKNARDIQATCRYVPLERMLVETDSPYLAPVPKRGKTNEPSFVHYTAEFVAQLRGQSLDVIAEATTDNFYRLFHKVPRPLPAAAPQSMG